MAEDRSTLDALRGSRILAFTLGAISLAAGLVLLFWPDRTIEVVAKLGGVLLLIAGVVEVLEALTTHRKGSYWGLLALRGGLNVVFGGLLLFWPGPTLTVLVWLFGLDLVLAGIVGLIASRNVPAELGRTSYVVRSGVAIVLGIAVMVWPSATLSVIAFLIAIELILFGLIVLWFGWELSKVEPEATA